jgi:hypothetical protein
VTDLTLKKSLTAAVIGFALLAAACGGGDEPALSANTSVPTSQFEAASPAIAPATLDAVLAQVDQALADIDAALAASEDNR